MSINSKQKRTAIYDSSKLWYYGAFIYNGKTMVLRKRTIVLWKNIVLWKQTCDTIRKTMEF